MNEDEDDCVFPDPYNPDEEVEFETCGFMYED